MAKQKNTKSTRGKKSSIATSPSKKTSARTTTKEGSGKYGRGITLPKRPKTKK